MNWICEFCGYENEYNDESQPTECLCCGEPASEHLLNQARRALEKYHKEQERQRRLEQLRQEAIKRQEKIERSIKAFVKGVRSLATACIILMILSVAFAGFNIYKGNVTLNYIGANVKSITAMDNVVVPAKVISDNLSQKALELTDSIIQNVGYTAQGKNYAVTENLKGLADKNKESISRTLSGITVLADENKETMAVTVSGLKKMGEDFSEGYDNRTDNIAVSQSNISDGYNNLTVNLKLFWKQVTKNFNQLVDSISKKVGRSK